MRAERYYPPARYTNSRTLTSESILAPAGEEEPVKNVRWLVVGVLMLAACGAPPPVPPTAAEPAVAPLQPPPVFALIGQRETLELTSEQISALDSIGRWNSSANETVTRDPRVRDMRPGDPAVDSVTRVIRQNNLQAARGVETLLSDEQRRQVCEMFQPEGRRDGRAAPRGAQGRPRTGAQGRAGRPGMMEDRQLSVWPWCSDPAATTPPGEDPPPRQ